MRPTHVMGGVDVFDGTDYCHASDDNHFGGMSVPGMEHQPDWEKLQGAPKRFYLTRRQSNRIKAALKVKKLSHVKASRAMGDNDSIVNGVLFFNRKITTDEHTALKRVAGLRK